jgi:hypothetical protein
MPPSTSQRAVLAGAILLLIAGAVSAALWHGPARVRSQPAPSSEPVPSTSVATTAPTAVPSPPTSGTPTSAQGAGVGSQAPPTGSANPSLVPASAAVGRQALPATGLAETLELLGTVFILAGGALVWIEERTRLLAAVYGRGAVRVPVSSQITVGRTRRRHQPQHRRSRRS